MQRSGARRSQRGGGRLKLIITLVIVGLLAYLGIKIVPHFVNYYELRDHMEQTATLAAVSNKSEMEIRESIWRKIQELEIPANREDLKVTRAGRDVHIRCHYTAEVPFLGYTIRLNFDPQSDKRRAW